ncbi:hypothetical protein [Hoylesella enoeca]|uniref:Uncharacterized protein n=1 Tax=Hoylesella enoeca TaxID=76123 RepID=A0A0S2KLF5_9BACT|nr:hypothetical protein [Hoylesella enoeca]ALO49137.1 hypothetical protein AS203_08600 [Hoylesella enoeca]
MIQTLLLSMLIIAISLALLCVKLIFKKGGKFSSQHIHDNAGLRKQGIHCVIDQDREARAERRAY